MKKSKPARNKGGRPLLGLERRERYQVKLEPRTAEKIRRFGGNNLSGGIALLAEKFL